MFWKAFVSKDCVVKCMITVHSTDFQSSEFIKYLYFYLLASFDKNINIPTLQY